MAPSGIALKDHSLYPAIVIAGIANKLLALLRRFGWMLRLIISRLSKAHHPYTNPLKRGGGTSAQSAARNYSSQVSMNRVLSTHTPSAWIIQTCCSPPHIYGRTGKLTGSSSTTNYQGMPETYPKKNKPGKGVSAGFRTQGRAKKPTLTPFSTDMTDLFSRHLPGSP